jgi:hypothetical protein
MAESMQRLRNGCNAVAHRDASPCRLLHLPIPGKLNDKAINALAENESASKYPTEQTAKSGHSGRCRRSSVGWRARPNWLFLDGRTGGLST